MKNLIIIGAGGMGRTMYDLARESTTYEKEYVVKGYIDDNVHALDDFSNYPPVIGTIADYSPAEDDVFVCSIGGESRKACMEAIIARGGEFITMIHRTARIGTNVHIGKGCCIGAFTTVASDAWIDDYNFIQSYTIVGHDVRIGRWNRIDSYVMLVGGVVIGEHNMIHTAAVLNHNVVVGNDAHIGACSLVINNVTSGTTVFGNPARRIK